WKWGARLEAGEPLLHPADLQPDRRLRGRSARAGRGRAPRDGAAQTVNARDRGSLAVQAPARAREAPAPHGPGPRALRAGAVCYDAGRVRIHRAPPPSRLPTARAHASARVLLRSL